MQRTLLGRAAGTFAVVSLGGLLACSSAAGTDATGEDTASTQSALGTAAPAWVVYPGGPENHFRNSLNVAVGMPVRMVPVYGGGKPTRYELRSLAHIYGGSSALPRGLTFDSSTGILSGNPAEPTSGVSYFSVTASNELGVAQGSDGWGTQRILRVNVLAAGTPITNGWYFTDAAWDGVYRPTSDDAIAAAPELLRAARLRTFGDWVTFTVDYKKPAWTPWAPSSRRVDFGGVMRWSDGRQWPYNLAADLWCNGNATTNIQVSNAGDITVTDPNFKAAPPMGECLCPADTSWNPLARDGRGNCERQVDCKITTTECPNFPDYVGTFSDVPDYWTDSMSWTSNEKGLCASRAQGWADRCGTSRQVKAEYTVNDVVKDTTTYGTAPVPPPVPGVYINDMSPVQGYVMLEQSNAICDGTLSVAKGSAATAYKVATYGLNYGEEVNCLNARYGDEFPIEDSFGFGLSVFGHLNLCILFKDKNGVWQNRESSTQVRTYCTD
jgi:hypothetical protein